MSEWQFRKHYGPKPDGSAWTEWEDVAEGTVHYSPRTLLNLNPDASGRIEFRVKPLPSCEVPRCDGAVDEDGLCAWHWEELNEVDLWPDFHDEPGHWEWDKESQCDRFYRD